ncbi:MAG TPA: hypothetical protein PLL10_01240, partial [Elusimicrobiales bacterium]|nr:hypothetical protein [Elusimicrobiales bacterium]
MPFTGIVNFIWENMSASYAANFRYTLHWYPFAAACLALALLHLLKLAKTPEPKRFSAILLTLLALKGITLGWKTSDGVWLNKNLRALTQAQIESGDKNVRVADDRFRYYIPEAGPAQGFPLLYQSQVDELQKLYDRLDIGVIALSKNNQEFWDKTVLGKAVQDSDFAYLSSETDWQRI